MKSAFNYYGSISYLDCIDINDIGNCIIQCNNDKGEMFFLWIKTQLGLTRILSMGPYIYEKDLQAEIKSFYTSYSKINYSESKIHTTIKSFLNDYKKEITQAREITEEELREYCDFNTLDFMREW